MNITKLNKEEFICHDPIILTGEKAFYNDPNYLGKTKKDFYSPDPSPSARYSFNTKNQNHILDRIKNIFERFFPPVWVYKFLQFFAGYVALLPAAGITVSNKPFNYYKLTSEKINFEGKWKYLRFSFNVNGKPVDVKIMGTPSTLGNGRWLLHSNGNCGFSDGTLSYNNELRTILDMTHSNALLFDYPSVGSSKGYPNKEDMKTAYIAMLNLLERAQDEGAIDAKEIIGYGHSIGGGVQGEALKKHELKNKKYVFVKSRSFSDLSTAASHITIKPLGLLVKLLGWNLDSVTSSEKLKVPEIILQSAKVDTHFQRLKDSSLIIDDGVIPAKATLGKKLLDKHGVEKFPNKVFLGMKEGHNNSIKQPWNLAKEITRALGKPESVSHKAFINHMRDDIALGA